MAKGTDFGGVHSHRNLGLIQQQVEVAPAEPKTNLVNVPGADGSKDLSTLPAGRITYKDRKITWTFALYPGDNWDRKHHQVSNALNGKECRITLDSDPGYYYIGRLTVKKYKLSGLLRQITVEATCRPYALKKNPTIMVAQLLDYSDFTEIVLVNDRMPTVPTFEVTAETTIRWNGQTVTVAPGTFTSLDIVLQEGINLLEAKATGDPSSVVITYQEGSL